MDEPRTVREIAKQLGREDGAVRYIVNAMAESGELRRTARGDTRAIAWKATRSGLRLHEQGRDSSLARGTVAVGQHLVACIDQGRGLPLDALTQIASDRAVRWCARLDGVVLFLIAFDESGDAAADRLRVSIASAGGQSAAGRVGQLVAPEDLPVFFADRAEKQTPRELTQ